MTRTEPGLPPTPASRTRDFRETSALEDTVLPAGASPDDTEFLQRRVFSIDEALRWALHGEIMDSTSLVGLALAALRSSPPR